jgi:hypothetical protein
VDCSNLDDLAIEAGYRIDWRLTGADESVRAAVAAHVGDLGPTERRLAAATRPIGSDFA